MRQTGRCPSCNAGSLLHFRRVRERTDSGLTDLSLLKRSSAWGFSVKEGAPLEAYACRACHLVEWHAITFEDIEVDGEHIVEITAPADPEADAGPYR